VNANQALKSSENIEKARQGRYEKEFSG
jgi:hypothetical protein